MKLFLSKYNCTSELNVPHLSLSRIQQEVPSKAVLEQEMVWMKEHLSTLGSPVVLCHNDLLCKNIIHNSKEGGCLLPKCYSAGLNVVLCPHPEKCSLTLLPSNGSLTPNAVVPMSVRKYVTSCDHGTDYKTRIREM